MTLTEMRLYFALCGEVKRPLDCPAFFVKVSTDMDVDSGRATAPLLKALNERTVLEAIRRAARRSRGPRSRAASGISKPTVSLALQSLLEAGLVREAAPRPDGPSYGAVFFEPVPDAGPRARHSTSARRFLRGAVADLSGAVRARQDVELHGADAAAVLAVIDAVRGSLLEASRARGRAPDRLAVVGVPGVVGPGDDDRARRRLARARRATGFSQALARPARRSRCTFENDVNLAALGEQWRGVAQGVDDFAFLSVGTGTGVGLVLGGELHRGRHGAAGEIDLAYAGLGARHRPVRGGARGRTRRGLGRNYPGGRPRCGPPYDTPAVFAAARAGDAAGRAGGRPRRRAASRPTSSPIAAVADVALVVLGGGIGANGDLLLTPVRGLLQTWLPYPPTSRSRASARRPCCTAPSPRRCAARSTTSSAAAAASGALPPQDDEGAPPRSYETTPLRSVRQAFAVSVATRRTARTRPS